MSDARDWNNNYKPLSSRIQSDDIRERLELTFGRSVVFRVYDLDRSERLRKLKFDFRIADILRDWNNGEPLTLDGENCLKHNRQQNRVLAAVERWEPNVYAVMRLLAYVEPDLVCRRDELHISTKVTWPEDRLIRATDPHEELNQNPYTFCSINHLLRHGLCLYPPKALEELASIRKLESEEADIELLDF